MTLESALMGALTVVGGALATLFKMLHSSSERRAQEWKDLYIQEAADHAKTLAKAEKLVEALERRLRESSRPPAMTSGTSRQE